MVWLHILKSCFVLFWQNREKLSGFLMWAISTALKSDSARMLQLQESHHRFTISSEEEIHEDSLISRLLRWLTAAIILGKLSWKSNDFGTKILNRFKLETLQSLLDLIENECDESIKRFDCEDLLAAVIFYLQQLHGINCRVLPSVISALCLLFSASSFSGKLLWLVVWHIGLNAGVGDFDLNSGNIQFLCFTCNLDFE